MELFFETLLAGIQGGIFLFLFAAGLTLVVGIMNMVNLAHGSIFMMGAYFAAYTYQQTDSFLLAVVAAVVGALILGIWLEFLALQTLYDRDHLDQVLATFGALLFFAQLVQRIFGTESQELAVPGATDPPLQIPVAWMVGILAVAFLIFGWQLARQAGYFGGNPQGKTSALFGSATTGRIAGGFFVVGITVLFYVTGAFPIWAGLAGLVAAGLIVVGTKGSTSLALLAGGFIMALVVLANIVGMIDFATSAQAAERGFGPGSGQTQYPLYRIVVTALGILVAIGLFLLIAKTRMGMLIRAGASNRAMVGALGINIRLLYTLVFGLGAALAGFAGVMIGALESVDADMGNQKLMIAFVIIVVGGLGSVRGAFVAAVIVGLVDAGGRVFMKDGVLWFLVNVTGMSGEVGGEASGFAETAGPALASMLIYIFMAFVLFFRPQGLFPARTG